MLWNTSKTNCMIHCPKAIIKPKTELYMSNVKLDFIDKCKYLGTFIELKSTDADVKRQIRKFYGNINMLLRKFNKCSCMLYNSFCTSMYCSQFWHQSTIGVMNKLRVCYNNCLRRLLNIPRFYSASEMFVSLNIKSFGELMRQEVFNFIQRLKNSGNVIISCIIDSYISIYSTIWKWWIKILYWLHTAIIYTYQFEL